MEIPKTFRNFINLRGLSGVNGNANTVGPMLALQKHMDRTGFSGHDVASRTMPCRLSNRLL